MYKILLFFICFTISINAQVLQHKKDFSHQDSLRGSDNEFRNWWDVVHYDITVEPNFQKKFLKGKNAIEFRVISQTKKQIMQIDLQEPMQILAIKFEGKTFKNYKREGNVYFLDFGESLSNQTVYQLEISFEGHPKIAVRPPWDGGWIFTNDEKGRPWMTVACEGLGASVWFPNKDFQGDEPDNGVKLTIITDQDLYGVGNGQLMNQEDESQQKSYTWEVKNPINNYNITPYIGAYTSFSDTYKGEKGNLNLTYWVLDYNKEKAEKQFQQVKGMLQSFEYWFGPYPFYEDGYQLVESPHLGMEHQSAIAYGNHFENGYLGRDLSETGWGLKWDFIIVHESGHEWFGNNMTSKDVADMWIHESFTAYSETLFTESQFGKEAGNDYVIGTRLNILNDIPIIGIYGVNQEGSGDMYYKGANMIHTFRQLLENDNLFRKILRGLNEKFYHQTVTTKQVENYISEMSHIDLTEFFDQYLRTTMIPKFEYKINGNKISYRWTHIVEGFDMPVKISNSDKWLYPTDKWKTESLEDELLKNFSIDRNFYIQTQKLD